MQESISVMRDEGSEIFLISLDTRKAYDTVWHEGLFFKLFRAGINRKIWRLLFYWYKSAEGIVICSGSQSDRYAVKQGVRQGRILSTHLYQLYLLFELEKSGHGNTHDGTYFGSPCFMDDLILIVKSPNPWMLCWV